MLLHLRHWLSATILIFLLPTVSLAQIIALWNGTNGNWTDAFRWNTNPNYPHNGQPNVGDTYNARVDGGTVTLDQNIAIQSLFFTGAAITGGGNLTLNSSSIWTSGVMNGAGTTFFNGPLTIGGVADLSRIFNNNSTTTWNGGIIQGNGTWNNQFGTLFDSQNGGVWNGTGTINNAAGAIFRKSAGTTPILHWTFNNAGIVEVNSGGLFLAGGGSSSGTGAFNTVAGTTLALSGYTLAAGTSINGAGAVSFTTSPSTINGSFAATGLVSVATTVGFDTSATFISYSQTSGSLQGSGNVTITGAASWTGGFMSGGGTTTFNGPLTLNGNSFIGIARTLNNNSITTWSNNGNIEYGVGAVWNNQNGALFDIQNNEVWFGPGTINNHAGATFRKSSGGGFTTLDLVFNNAGIVEINTGTLVLGGGSSSGAGAFNTLAGTTLGLRGYTLAAGTSINGAGGVSFSTNPSTINGTFAATGLVSVATTVDFNTSASFSTYSQTSGSLQGPGNITILGNAAWASGTMAGSGITRFFGPLTITGGIDVSRTINNHAAATWSGTADVIGNGAWTNGSGASFEVQNNQMWVPAFNNLGSATFTKSVGTGTTVMSGGFNNSGTVNVNSGTLLLNGGAGLGSGVFNTALGTTLDLRGYTLGAGASINGAGTVVFNTSPSTVNGTFAATGLVDVASTVNFNTPATFSTYIQTSGSLQGTGNVAITGAAAWFSGSMAGTGVTTFNGPLAITGGIDVSRTINNNAAATWSEAAAVTGNGTWNNENGAIVDIQKNLVWSGVGAIINKAGAIFRKSSGGGTTTLGWTFTNSGTVESQSGTIAFNGGFTQTAGLTLLNGGNFTASSVMSFNGGSLTGSGTISSSALFSSASIAPGNSAGSITFIGNVTFGSRSLLDFELGLLSDIIRVTGNLTLDGTLDVTALSGFGAGTFTLIDYGGTLIDNGLRLGVLPPGFDYQILNDSANTRITLLVVPSVPEPSSLALATLAIFGVANYFCRRNSNSAKAIQQFADPSSENNVCPRSLEESTDNRQPA